ncbi:MAG: glycoside hydrolase family 95 protein [Provencibacterium sp.]|jgi:alpha-L-fucosidase 2|nr:glycoside hydrolase family 95 protein [Provencibacterium sp.]
MCERIWLDMPAKKWDNGLPIGNGRLGAMVLGAVEEEILALNEETMWYGGPLQRENPDAAVHIAQIRDLLQKGAVEEAAFLAKTALTSTPKYLSPYLPAGDLRLCFSGHSGEVRDYRRELSLSKALAKVSYTLNGFAYERAYFVSRAWNVVAVRLTGERPLTVAVNLNRRPYEERSGKLDGRTVFLEGQCGAEGVRYFGAARMACEGGTVETMGDYLVARQAQAVTLYVSFATDFGGRTDYRAHCLGCLDGASTTGYEALLKRHLRDHTELYNRVSFSLGVPLPDAPTSQLLSRLREGGDARALSTLLFHFGRYLLIASSSYCQLPATLQGLWNGSYTPAWESKYTININTEMNYWPAEPCALPECHLPLFDLVERMAERGEHTARAVYGCGGFVAHHNTNLWADTAIEGILDTSPIWPMGGAWLSLHLYEHFLYTQDEEFLRERALPVLRKAVTFFTEYLTPAADGTLLSGPSVSPENRYISRTGQRGALCMAPTMDSQILRELFSGYLAACRRLDVEEALCARVREALAKLPETVIAGDGRIREWHEDVQEVEPGHRHISHLFGLHPGTQITKETPELFEAAKKTLSYRLAHGGGHTGWSRAWILCMYARLCEGKEAEDHLRALLERSIQDNLLDVHPPFQIDGNFGAAAGIVEMLVQSHNPYIELLPALPPSWTEGKLTGIRLRGGFQMDFSWKGGVLEEATLTALKDGPMEVRCQGWRVRLELQKGRPVRLTPDMPGRERLA